MSCFMTSIYLELRPNLAAPPFRAFCNLALNPGLAPWAVLLDPFGVLGFAPETSLGHLGGHEVHRSVKFYMAGTAMTQVLLSTGETPVPRELLCPPSGPGFCCEM